MGDNINGRGVMLGKANVSNIRRLRLRDHARYLFTPVSQDLCRTIVNHNGIGKVVLWSGDSEKSLRPQLFVKVGERGNTEKLGFSREARRLHRAGITLEFEVGTMDCRTTTTEVGLVLWSLRALPRAWAEKLINLYTFGKIAVVDDKYSHEMSFTREHTFEALVTRDGYQTYGTTALMFPFLVLGALAGGALAGFDLPIIRHHMPGFLQDNYAAASNIARIAAGALVGALVGQLPLAIDLLANAPKNLWRRLTSWRRFGLDFEILDEYVKAKKPKSTAAFSAVEILERFEFDAAIAGYLAKLEPLDFDVLIDQVCKRETGYSRLAAVAFAYPKCSTQNKRNMILAGVVYDPDFAWQMAEDATLSPRRIAWLMLIYTRGRTSSDGSERYKQSGLTNAVRLLTEEYDLAKQISIMTELRKMGDRGRSLSDVLEEQLNVEDRATAFA